MATQRIETEATILDVSDDATWKYSIEADIPAFDGERSYRYLAWNKKQGPPPQKGAVGVGTFEPYQRAKYYVERGDVEAGPVDGTETQYMVTWNMVGFVAGATNGAGATQSTAPAPSDAVRPSSNAPAVPGTTYLPAPTAGEKMAKELAKYVRDNEAINDRKAVSDLLALVEPGAYTLDGLVTDAERLADWYNDRMRARLAPERQWIHYSEEAAPASPLVEAAQEMGAVVTDVRDEVTAIKNRPDLDAYVKGKGWAKKDISRVIQDRGHASSAAYLQDSSNSVQGLASLLTEHLDSW